MIRFTAPWVLGALGLLLGPLLIHLLQRRQVRRRVVPTVRFVPHDTHSSLRPRTPDDVWLLLIRMAVLAAAVCALAGPIVVTAGRQAAWDARVVRAVLVDTSSSATTTSSGDELARRELESAAAGVRISSERLGDGLRRATNWFKTAPPGRHEIVVLSDFQRGALDRADLRHVPAAVGLRFVTTGSPAPESIVAAGSEFYDGVPYTRSVSVDGPSATLSLTRIDAAVPIIRFEGTTPELAARLERIVRRAGVVFPNPPPNIVVRFGESRSEAAALEASGAATPADAAALRLLQDDALRGIAFSATTNNGALVVTTAVEASSLEAAALVRAAIASWWDPAAHAEAEPLALSEDVLQGWSRQPGPADPSAWRHVHRTDARWFWALALFGLCAEWMIRRRAPADVGESHAHAA
jgi:hypothetical protein